MTIPNDPFGTIKPDRKKDEEDVDARATRRMHAHSDVDSGSYAQHHTLGTKHNQSAPGDHTHTGKDSLRLGKGASLSVTGSRGGNAALASLLSMLSQVIDFNDGTTA